MFHTLRPLITRGGAYDQRSPEYRAYVVLKWAAILLVLDYSLIAFCLLDFHRGFTVLRSWYFYGHVGTLVAVVVCAIVTGGRAASGKGSSGSRHPVAAPHVHDKVQ